LSPALKKQTPALLTRALRLRDDFWSEKKWLQKWKSCS